MSKMHLMYLEKYWAQKRHLLSRIWAQEVGQMCAIGSLLSGPHLEARWRLVDADCACWIYEGTGSTTH